MNVSFVPPVLKNSAGNLRCTLIIDTTQVKLCLQELSLSETSQHWVIYFYLIAEDIYM